MQRGFVRFLPLLLTAVALIGVVGYVSVNRLKNNPTFRSAVLSDSDSGSSGGGGSGGGSHDSGGSSGGSSSGTSGSSSDQSSGGSSSTTTTTSHSGEDSGSTKTGEAANPNITTVKTESETEISGDDLNKVETDLNSQEKLNDSELELPEIETPDNLAQEALKLGSLDTIERAETVESSQAGTPKTVRVEGFRNLKLLGLVPVTAPVSVELDATTGQQLNVTEPQWLQLLNFLFTK